MDVEKAGEQDTTDMGGCISLQGFGFWEREGRDKQQPHTWKLIRGGVKQNGPPLNFFRALIDHMHASSLISSLEAIDVEVRCLFFLSLAVGFISWRLRCIPHFGGTACLRCLGWCWHWINRFRIRIIESLLMMKDAVERGEIILVSWNYVSSYFGFLIPVTNFYTV